MIFKNFIFATKITKFEEKSKSFFFSHQNIVIL